MLTALMVLMVVFSNAAGDVFLTRGMKQIGDVSALNRLQILQTTKQIFGNLNFILGVVCLAVSFFSFLTVLSWADLSFVVPATAIVYVVTVLGAKFFLHEQIDRLRWAGTIFVCLGVALICLPDDRSLSISMILDSVRALFGILTAASACYYLVSIIAAEKFFATAPPRHTAEYRPVSILIPLCGEDSRAYQNYASLCRQDYPEFEIVFGVGDSRDSSLPVIARLRADFPDVPVQLVIGADEIGPNPKVNTLNNMLPQARHETLLMLDSDIRVGPDFIKAITAELPLCRGSCHLSLSRRGGARNSFKAGSRRDFLGICPGCARSSTGRRDFICFRSSHCAHEKNDRDHRRLQSACSLSGR